MNASEKSSDAGRRGLLAHMSLAEDFRRGGRHLLHPLTTVLFTATVAVATGARSYYEIADFAQAEREWLARFVDFPHGVPSHDTFRRVLSLLPADELGKCCRACAGALRTCLAGDTVAIDGKVIRRAPDPDGRLPCMVSAWSCSQRLVVGEMRAAEKSNEIRAMPELVASLPIRGAVISADAAGCQREMAAAVVGAGADYVFALKGNQGTMEREMREELEAAAASRPPDDETVEKGHGRIETRRTWSVGDLSWFADRGKWRGLRSAFMVEARRERGGGASTERRLYVTSLPPDAKDLSRRARAHWGVENGEHWRLDVVFREDLCRARWCNAAVNLSLIRHAALNMLMASGKAEMSVDRKMKLAALDRKARERMVRGE